MTDISAPAAGAYNIWGPAYAQALAGQTGNPVSGPLNMMAMRGYMGNEQGAYSQDLAATQQAQLAALRAEANAKIQEALINQIPGIAQHGATGYVDPIMQQAGLMPNAEAGAVIDENVIRDIAAGAFKDRSAGTAAMAEAGFAPPPEAINETLMPPDPNAALAEYVPYMSPSNQADITSAEARKTSAQADVISANRPRGGGGGGSSTAYTIEPPLFPGMPPRVVIRTKDGAMAEEYMGSGQARPGANSVERSGGARSAAQRLADLLNE